MYVWVYNRQNELKTKVVSCTTDRGPPTLAMSIASSNVVVSATHHINMCIHIYIYLFIIHIYICISYRYVSICKSKGHAICEVFRKGGTQTGSSLRKHSNTEGLRPSVYSNVAGLYGQGFIANIGGSTAECLQQCSHTIHLGLFTILQPLRIPFRAFTHLLGP